MRTLTTNEVDVNCVTSIICSLYGHNTSHINDARYNVFIRLTTGGIQAHTRNIKKINWKGVMHQIQQMDLNP